jgi:endonuclease/exonuclease/phosphatase family metal-dependent hydrolase
LHVVNNHFDHRLKSLRQEEALALTAFLESMQISSNLVITGDFNVGPTSPVYGYLTGRNFLMGQRQPRPLVDAYATGHPGRGTEVTLNAFQLPVPSYAERIDHIFLSPDLRAQSARIHSDTEDGFASDHYPVTATVIRER